jgi:hypothetical protein
MSRFERGMEGRNPLVEVIHANSQEAKGRLERLKKTHEDRLVKEMRLKGISSNVLTVIHNKKLYQFLEPANTKDVIVEERINSRMLITHHNKALGFKEIYSRPLKEKPKKPFKIRKKYTPPKDHPCRKEPVLPKQDISTLVKIGHF